MSAYPHAKPELERDTASLLDDVLNGRRTLLFPPGTLVASLLVPCMCVAGGSLGFVVRSLVAPQPATPEDPMPALLPMIIGLAVVSVSVVIQVLLTLGFSKALGFARLYGSGLLLVAIALGITALTVSQDVPTWIAIAPALALALCLRIATSRALLAYSSFLALKRDYRRDPDGTRARILEATDPKQ